jgi:hypothetical protein
LRTLFRYLRSNPVSLVGAWVTTLSFLMMVSLSVFELAGQGSGPYSGLVLFLVLPGVFTAGLVAIPVGLLIFRRRLRERLEADVGRPLHILRTIGVLTIVNLVVVGVMGYHGYHYTDSVEFCGTLCHEVMEPYYRTYRDSPHARVACVDCHIGPGASWFVQSKLSGVRQVLAVMRDDFSRPIPTPVEDLRPARETCEQCHWPEKFIGDRVVVRRRHRYDRDSTPYQHVLVVRTGGVRPDGEATGIHWHVHSRVEVTFRATDRKRMEIPWVRLRNRETGEETVFTLPGVDPDAPPEGETRTMDCVDCHNSPSHVLMDCVDCHNSPSHVFRSSWESVDEAIAAGRISRRLPYVKKVARRALEHGWGSDPEARAGIARELAEAYPESVTDEAIRQDVDRAVSVLVEIWSRNVHPEMGIGWNTYPSLTGHRGCFRCHDDDHRASDGRVISMDCETCHAVLAYRVENPPILETLRVEGD